MSTETTSATGELVERLSLKTLLESCLVLEDGIAGIKDIEIGMMAGAAILPGPFARADEQGLDTVLEALERARSEWGERYAPPKILRRLVAQGRLGKKTGQGFFPYPQPDAGFEQGEAVKLQTLDLPGSDRRVAIAWLDRPPANSISPEVIAELARAWSFVEEREEIRA